MLRVLAAAASALVLAGAAAAQDEDAVYAAYGAYQDALAAGDQAGASANAEQAWRLAEDVWGDHDNTAVLAFNYATYLFDTGRPAEAGEPSARAASLIEAGFAADKASLRDAQLIAAVSGLASDDRRRARDARDELEALLKGAAAPTSVSARARLELARDALARSREREAIRIAEAAEAELRAAAPDAPFLAADALILQAAAEYARNDLESADALLHRALELAPQRDLSAKQRARVDFELLAWLALVHAEGAAGDAEFNGPRHGSQGVAGVLGDDVEIITVSAVRNPEMFGGKDPVSERFYERNSWARREVGEGKRRPFCGKWEFRPPIMFPVRAAEQARNGVAVVTYELVEGDDKPTANLRFITGGDDFRKATEDAVARWRMSAAFVDGCQQTSTIVMPMVLLK